MTDKAILNHSQDDYMWGFSKSYFLSFSINFLLAPIYPIVIAVIIFGFVMSLPVYFILLVIINYSTNIINKHFKFSCFLMPIIVMVIFILGFVLIVNISAYISYGEYPFQLKKSDLEAPLFFGAFSLYFSSIGAIFFYFFMRKPKDNDEKATSAE